VDGTAQGDPVRVTAQDVGCRVVLRYRLAEQEHGRFGETLSDLVGELLEWPGDPNGQATVRRRSGEQVSIERARIVAGKVIPTVSQKSDARSPRRPH